MESNMILPIKLAFKQRSRFQWETSWCGNYRIAWQSTSAYMTRDDSGPVGCIRFHYPTTRVQLLINRKVLSAAGAPRRAFYRLMERFYYGRLTYQYELGMARGRREVLLNLDTYRDLSKAEIEAVTQDPEY
jgi:hypothetical protein